MSEWDDAVIGRTAGLWRCRPVPADEPEPAPECASMAAALPGAEVIAARVRGRKHRHEGANCDDWFEIANWEDVTFIAVSDGAGSRKFSRIGARESCRAAVGCLRGAFRKRFAGDPGIRERLQLELTDPPCMRACEALAELVRRAMLEARAAVEAAWRARSADPAYAAALGRELELRDFAGTLLLAALVPLEGRQRLAISCQVGDGAIALLDAGTESVKLMGDADRGEFAGETEFLTSIPPDGDGALRRRTRLFRGAADVLLVMTDGVADDYFPAQARLHGLYLDLLANGALDGRDGGERLKLWLDNYVERGSFDDRTLVIARL